MSDGENMYSSVFLPEKSERKVSMDRNWKQPSWWPVTNVLGQTPWNLGDDVLSREYGCD